MREGGGEEEEEMEEGQVGLACVAWSWAILYSRFRRSRPSDASSENNPPCADSFRRARRWYTHATAPVNRAAAAATDTDCVTLPHASGHDDMSPANAAWI